MRQEGGEGEEEAGGNRLRQKEGRERKRTIERWETMKEGWERKRQRE